MRGWEKERNVFSSTRAILLPSALRLFRFVLLGRRLLALRTTELCNFNYFIRENPSNIQKKSTEKLYRRRRGGEKGRAAFFRTRENLLAIVASIFPSFLSLSPSTLRLFSVLSLRRSIQRIRCPVSFFTVEFHDVAWLVDEEPNDFNPVISDLSFDKSSKLESER